MKPHPTAEVHETDLAILWLDEHGILCAVSKSTPRSVERQKATYEVIRKITGNRRICMLADNSITASQDDATRDYSALELPNLVKAMAVISESAVGRAVSHLFLFWKGNPVPIDIFHTEEEAREWLKQYNR